MGIGPSRGQELHCAEDPVDFDIVIDLDDGRWHPSR